MDNQDISWTPNGSPLYGQSILVTGGTGAFGRAFVKRSLQDGARRVVVFSRDEAKQAKMKSEISDPRIRYMIGSVSDYTRVLEACRDVDIVIHAAALKRVETCEANPWQAIETNVNGTQSVARACIAAGVTKGILLSTDKAAAPNTLYGATKLTAERIWTGANVYSAGTETRFSCTRYGNVAKSTGSVIPIWKAQHEKGEPITLTDSRMTRFLMSMDEAVNLVMLALSEMRGAEIFIPKIKASRMVDLAKAAFPGWPIRIMGVRPGEKIHETLVTEDEGRQCFDAGSHYVLEPNERSWGGVPALPFGKVEEGFTYRSDNAEILDNSQLLGLAA